MSFSVVKLKINKKVWDFIKDYFYYQRIPDSPVVLNINDDCKSGQKRAILCYLTISFFNNWDSTVIGRTQPFEIMKILKIISGFGYSVDVIGYNDVKALDILRNRKYDLIFGFGEAFFQITNLYPQATSILYMTENTPEFSYKQEKDRIDYFYKRHGRKIRLSRSGKFYKNYHLEKRYSHVITMGETEFLKKAYCNPMFIFPTGLRNASYTFTEKDHKQSRRNYLWLGSTGAVHKGLDILLDIFYRRDDIILHICGLQKEEKMILRLQKRENIIEYGHVNINSETYLDLVNKCSYIILPSCSEGFSTSVTTGMLHGLIPVVIRNTGFNRAGDHAIFLEDFKLEYIDSKLHELSNSDPQELSKLSKKVFEFAQENFCIEAFADSFKAIMTNIITEI
jgi:hypothetical protein